MNEIEWLDKVKKNFEYEDRGFNTGESVRTLNQLFRDTYAGVIIDEFVNTPNPFLRNLIPPVR